jgi:hypothetical protein
MHIVTHLRDELAQQVRLFHKLQKYLLKCMNKFKNSLKYPVFFVSCPEKKILAVFSGAYNDWTHSPWMFAYITCGMLMNGSIPSGIHLTAL